MRRFWRTFFALCAAEFAPLGLPEAMLNQLLDMQQRAQTEGYSKQYPYAVQSIILQGAERAGQMLVARGWQAIHLVDISLMPEYRGAGTGGFLLRALCDEAHAAGVPVRLSVRCGSPAVHLYRRAGFVLTGDDAHSHSMQSGPDAGDA